MADLLTVANLDEIKTRICQSSEIKPNMLIFNFYLNILKSMGLDKVVFGTPYITDDDFFDNITLNKTDLNSEVNKTLQELYKIKHGNILLIAPDVELIQEISRKYNEYFYEVKINMIKIMKLLNYLYSNHVRLAIAEYYSRIIMEVYQNRSYKNSNETENMKVEEVKKIPATDTTLVNYDTRVLGLMPWKTKISNIEDIENNDYDILNGAEHPLFAVNFTEFNVNYSYKIIFHSYLSHTNSDPWKQYFIYNLDL